MTFITLKEEKFTKILDAYTDSFPKFCVNCTNYKMDSNIHSCILRVGGEPNLVTGVYPTKMYHCVNQRHQESSELVPEEFRCGPEGKLYHSKKLNPNMCHGNRS